MKKFSSLKKGKWSSKILAAMLSVAMLSSLSVPSFAAKVIKPKSAQTASQEMSKEAAPKKVIKKDSERLGPEEVVQDMDEEATTEKVLSSSEESTGSKTAVEMQTHKLGNMQFQTPSEWTPIESDSITMIFSPFDNVSTMMFVMAFDPVNLSGSSQQETNSFYQAYASGFVSALAEQEGTQTQEELTAVFKNAIESNGGEVKDFSFIKGTDFPGIKTTVTINNTETKVIFLFGKKYDVMIMGTADSEGGMADVDSMLAKITASVKTVK